jgi:hypothetical protein
MGLWLIVFLICISVLAYYQDEARRKIVRPLARRIARQQKLALAEIGLLGSQKYIRVLNNVEVLDLALVRDEASRWLRTCSWIASTPFLMIRLELSSALRPMYAWLLGPMYGWLNNDKTAPAGRGVPVVVVLVVPIFAWFMFSSVRTGEFGLITALGTSAIFSVISSVTICISAIIALWTIAKIVTWCVNSAGSILLIVSALVLRSPFAFGRASVWLDLLMRRGVLDEKETAQSCKVVRLQIDKEVRGPVTRIVLRHSLVYEMKESTRIVSEWIALPCDERKPGVASKGA